MVARQVQRRPKVEVTFTDLQKKVRSNSLQVQKITKAILRHENVDRAVLCIVFVTSQRIKALNKKYLNRDHVTDVLAFDFCDTPDKRRKAKSVTGDVIISTDAALKSVRAYETTLAEELALYIVHGILHLLGYDDHTPGDTRKMRRKEKELLSYLGRKINTLTK